jgi:hypothetical protein
MGIKVIKSCLIRKDEVKVDGETVLRTENEIGSSKQFKEIYSFLGLKYPKFYKMDMLAKLSFLASELIISDETVEIFEDDTAILLMNKNSTENVDRKYNGTIHKDNYFPNPALFVYTLPNVMIGEISIRNNIKGETLFLASEKFDELVTEQVIEAMEFKNILLGYVDYRDETDFEACLFFGEKVEEETDLRNKLNLIYNS